MSAQISADKLAIIVNQKVKEREYWLKQLVGETVIASFPYEKKAISTGDVKEKQTHSLETRFPAALFDRLLEMSGHSDYTLHVVLTAGVAALLYKYTGHRDFIIGTPIYKQPAAGEFINTVLPLRIQLHEKSSFKDLLIQTRQKVMEAVEHQRFPVQYLANRMKGSQPEPGNGFKLLDTAILLRNIQEEKDIAPAAPSICFSCLRANRHLEMEVHYRASLDFLPNVQQVVQHLEQLFTTVLEHLEKELPSIDILSPGEKQVLLETFNGTSFDYPSGKTIHELFEEQVERIPHRTAVTAAGPVSFLTYNELNESSNRLAYLLAEHGVVHDSIVALMVERSLEMMIGILGILKAGGAYLPIDPGYPEERKHYILADSGVKILLSDDNNPETVPGFIHAFDIANFVRSITRNQKTGEKGVEIGLCPVPTISSTNSLAYIIYTSGSTGKPKGVMIRHYSLVNRLNWMQREYSLDENDTILQKTTYTFDVSVWELLWWGLVGAKCCFLVPGGEKDAQLIVETVERNNITVMHFVPSMLNAFLDYVKITVGVKKLKALRQVIASGEALTLSQVELFNELLYKENSTKLANLYGPTEASIDVSSFDCSTGEKFRVIPIGKPIDNTRFYVVDRHMNLLPLGIAGELCIAGEGLARGYLNRPELTEEKFVATDEHRRTQATINKTFCGGPGPAARGAYKRGVLYRTGDLARWMPDGNVEFLGRIDHQVKIRGFRIELGEIENQLLKHRDIKEAVVISRDSENGDKYLCAYLVAAGEIPSEELNDYLLKSLPDYMVPTYFIFLEKIPLTENGKVNRKALPEPENKTGVEFIAPRDEVEDILARIWSEELGIEKAKIGIDTSFFGLGGHSLRATRVIAKIHKELNVNITMAQMFDTPFIRKLAERVKQMATEKYASIEPGEKKEFYPLSSAQKRLYILQQIDSQGIGYNIPSFSILEGELHKDRLERAFKQLFNRHESLRTSFQVVNEEPVQRVHDEVEFEIDYIDADHGQGLGGDSEVIMPGSIIKDFVRPFDLVNAPLLHAGLVKLAEKKHILAVDMHHIISDGVSEQILFQDFANLYLEKELAAIRLQYRDYAGWQSRRKNSKDLMKQKEYWVNEFKGELPVLGLPADYARPAVQSFEGRTIQFELSEKTVEMLRILALESGITLFMLLLALYTVLLAKLANQEDIVVGTPVAGRRHADLEKIIGIFINTLTLRSFPSKEKKFSDFLREIKEKSLKAFENQDYQYEDLVEQVAVNRDVSRNPLFDTMFILQNIETWRLETAGLNLSHCEYQNVTAKFDLTLTGMEIENKLLFTLEYCTKIFTGETIERFIGFFKKITREISKNRKDITLSQIDILSAEEKKRILFDFNDTETGYPDEKTIHRLFGRQAEQNPDSVALVGNGYGAVNTRREGTGELSLIPDLMTVTYRQLNETSDRLACILMEKGVQPGAVIGIKALRSIEMIAGLLGILKAGAAYLPLDPVYPPERIGYMLADSGAGMLLSDRVDSDTGPSPVPVLDFVQALHGTGQCPAFMGATEPLLAYVIFTSGSTGKPKGVMIEHRNVINFIQGICKEIAFLPGKAILAVTTISFDIFVLETLLPLTRGLKILLASERQQVDPVALEELLVKQNVQMAQFTPSRLKLLLGDGNDLRALRYTTELLVGGEALPGDLFKEIKNHFQGKIFNMYGPTETTVWSTFKDLTTLDTIDIGKPIANTQVYILDNTLGIQPVGVVGDLYIGGDGLARGYLNRPELTSERFCLRRPGGSFYKNRPLDSRKNFLLIHSPTHLLTHSTIYSTGDLARWMPDGSIEFLGRIDHQVKIRGFRIELGEIESQLLKCPGIEEAVVIDKEKERKQYLCAYVVSEQKLGISQLKGTLAKTLPDYMIPSYLIQVEKIPLTFNGKINRKALEAYDVDMQIREEYTAPRNELEQKIAQTWRDVLKRDRVGVNENFFDLGGTSMDIIRLSVKFKEVFNEPDTVMQMFRYPTIISFAEYLTRKREGIDSANDIQRTVSVNKIKKTRQNQKNKRMRGGSANDRGND